MSEASAPPGDLQTPGKDADKPSVSGFLHNLYVGSKTILGLLPSLLRILHTLETHSEIIRTCRRAAEAASPASQA